MLGTLGVGACGLHMMCCLHGVECVWHYIGRCSYMQVMLRTDISTRACCVLSNMRISGCHLLAGLHCRVACSTDVQHSTQPPLEVKPPAQALAFNTTLHMKLLSTELISLTYIFNVT